MTEVPPMTRDQILERIHKIRTHFGFGPKEQVPVNDFIEMVIQYDDVEPLSEVEADYFSRALVKAFNSMRQKKQAELS